MRWYFFIVLLSLLPLVSIFSSSDLAHTHDGLVHLPRIAAYFKALSDGQIPVRWAGDLNYGYGLPLFNFIYQLPYAIASLFLFLGASLVNSFKFTLALSYILSGIFMFAFARAFLKDDKKAFTVTIFYQFAPFRFVELLIRGSFGEVYTYAFLPLSLLGLTLLFKKLTYKWVILSALATAFLALSHNSVSLLFFAILLAFVFLFAKTKKTVVIGLVVLAFGILLTAFYWVPAMFEHRYTYGDLFMKNLYREHFAPLSNFFLPNLTNSETLQTGGVSVQIGLFHVLALILSLFLLIKGKTLDGATKKIVIGGLVLTGICLFFSQPISGFVWKNISFLRQFQFPWRFLSVIVFATSMLSIVFTTQKFFQRKSTYIVLLLLVIVSTVSYWQPSLGYDKVDEKYYWDFPLNTTYYGEIDLIWSAGPAKGYPKKPVEVIQGDGEVIQYVRKSSKHSFVVDAKTDIVGLVDHTQFFPGWQAYIDGNTVPIQFQDPNSRGEITFLVPKGRHDVKVVFRESPVRVIADTISVVSFFLLVILPFVPIWKKV